MPVSVLEMLDDLAARPYVGLVAVVLAVLALVAAVLVAVRTTALRRELRRVEQPSAAEVRAPRRAASAPHGGPTTDVPGDAGTDPAAGGPAADGDEPEALRPARWPSLLGDGTPEGPGDDRLPPATGEHGASGADGAAHLAAVPPCARSRCWAASSSCSTASSGARSSPRCSPRSSSWTT